MNSPKEASTSKCKLNAISGRVVLIKKLALLTSLILLLFMMPTSAQDIAMYGDQQAFYPDSYMGFYSNGAPNGYTNPIMQFETDTTGSYDFEFLAKGQMAGPDYPVLRIVIDGNDVHMLTISSTTYTLYYITGTFNRTNNHTVEMNFTNDYWVSPGGAGNDRNAYVSRVTLHGNYSLVVHANVNYDNVLKYMTMSYGLNSKNSPWNYYNEPTPIERFKLLQTDYMRIWIMDDYYWGWNEEFKWMPYKPDGTYDYTNLDKYVSSLLTNVSAIPYVTFTWCPYSFTYDGKYDTREHSAIRDFEGCSDYMANVIEHFYLKCKNEWNYCGDFSKWYFAVYNEPDCGRTYDNGTVVTEWTGYSNPNLTAPRPYSVLFNLVYEKAKAKAPTAKIGGFNSCGYRYDRMKLFLQETNPDFVSYHIYTKDMQGYYRSSNNLSALIKQIEGKDLPIIIGEHNMNASWKNGADGQMKSQYGQVYMASALAWMIKSETDVELFFETETGNTDAQGNTAFNMWYRSYIPKPNYYARLWFVNNIKWGDKIIDTSTNYNSTEILATEGKDKILVVINRLNSTQVVNITFGKKIDEVFKINDDTAMKIMSNELILTLSGYEVDFYKIREYRKDYMPYIIILIISALIAYNWKKIKKALK